MNIYNESWNFDCTEELYGYAVANIMSIFKILGLKQESYDIGNLFHKVLQYHRKFNQENIKDEYTRAQADTYFPNTEFTGFHVYSANRRKMSLLDWTTFPQIYTDYHLFTKCGLEDGDLYFIYGPVPIRKELIEAQKQPVLDLLNGNECKTDFNAYNEKFLTSIDGDVAREQDESDLSWNLGKGSSCRIVSALIHFCIATIDIIRQCSFLNPFRHSPLNAINYQSLIIVRLQNTKNGIVILQQHLPPHPNL